MYLLLIFAMTAAVYAKVTGAYFCAYDDFLEVHRAAFEDSRNVSEVFTTPHMNSLKYRPLNRLVILWTYYAGGENPLYYRVRNLGFHLANVALVYSLAYLLFASIPVSAAAAALFALHPLADQSIIGATWTNTMAHSAFFLGLLFFLASLKSPRWPVLLPLALLLGWISLLTYDPEVVIFLIMAVGIAVFFFTARGKHISIGYISTFCAGTGILMAAYFVLRTLFVPRGWSQAAAAIPEPTTILKNIGMYTVALVTPLDPVLANSLFGTPLPPQIAAHQRFAIVLAGAALLSLFAVGAALVCLFRRYPMLRRSFDWPTVAFLIGAIAASWLPLLVFQQHPSETYLYVSIAFYALLLAYVLERVAQAASRKSAVVYGAAVCALALTFSAATWTRNQRVVSCGNTALRIFASLPSELASGGAWTVFFAAAPGEGESRPYGFYAYRGIYTIGDDDEAITKALQLRYRNNAITGRLLQPSDSANGCPLAPTRQLCLRVHADGRVESSGSRVATQ
jgi:hypothetical protein